MLIMVMVMLIIVIIVNRNDVMIGTDIGSLSSSGLA
jgi:hypothetical protein